MSEITLLDPACGTMHFGLVAFDLFAKMYREELVNVGRPGWPETPPVAIDAEIPAAIVERNLYGIDIDLRAVQLSALALYLKAKALNREAAITASNLACADVLLLNGPRIDEFLKEMAAGKPVFSRVIKGVWPRLKDSGQLGSLLRLEAEIEEVVAKARKSKDVELNLFPEEFGDVYEGRAGYWERLPGQIAETFHEFIRRESSRGHDVGFFAGEAVKGFKLLDLMRRRFDVVVANPPYLTKRNMNPAMGAFLEKAYPKTKGDLYTAFIERCGEFLAPEARLGMVTQQSFMFISSYEAMRKRLLDEHALETLCHVGPHAFEEIQGEKVNTTLFVLRREPDDVRRRESLGTYFRLVKEPNAEAKRAAFERALGRLRRGERDPAVFHYRQGNFDTIPGSPWVYWITPGLRKLFETLPKLREVAQPKHGLSTCDNFRFLRLWWETRRTICCFDAFNCADAAKSSKRWFPYMKGGPLCRWYGNQFHIVNWWADGAEIKSDIVRRFPYLKGNWGMVVTNPNFYFRRGVTWTDLTSGRFSSRLSPGGFIFDVAGSSVFPDDVNLILALMNSTFAQATLKFINPTVHVQVGDLSRLPVPERSTALLSSLVDQAVALARADSEDSETTFDFIAPSFWATGLDDLAARAQKLAEIERQIDEEVYRLYGISPQDRRAIEEELAEPRTALENGADDSEEGEDCSASIISSVDDN